MRWSIVARVLCVLSAGLIQLGQTASAEELLPAGIYRFEADQPDRARYAEPEKGWDKLITHRFEHVLPPQARITYAVVARGEDPANNKIFFLPAPDYPLDRSTTQAPKLTDNLCMAYAVGYLGDGDGVCGGGSRGMRFAVLNSGFAFSLPDDNKADRVEPRAAGYEPSPEELAACKAVPTCNTARPSQWLSYETLTHHLDVFSLLTPKAYQDILFLPRSVTAYTQPVDGTEGVKIDEQRFVAIKAIHPEWYEIDLIAYDGEITPLWLRRDALIDDLWVTQRVKSPRFEFRVAVERMDEDSLWPVALRVIERKTGEVVQTVYDFPPIDEARGSAEDMLKLVDANFDGQPDISMPGFTGGAGPNYTRSIFLFNPRTGLFEVDEKLSELSQLVIDTKHRRILSAQRAGCCRHTSETYRYIGGKLTVVADWDESMTADGKWLETTVGKLVRGKMIRHTTRRRIPARN